MEDMHTPSQSIARHRHRPAVMAAYDQHVQKRISNQERDKQRAAISEKHKAVAQAALATKPRRVIIGARQ